MQYITKGDRETKTTETEETQQKSVNAAIDKLFYQQVNETQMAANIYSLINEYPDDFSTIFNRIMNASPQNLWQKNPVKNAKDALNGLINHKYAFGNSVYDTIDNKYNEMKEKNSNDRFNRNDTNTSSDTGNSTSSDTGNSSIDNSQNNAETGQKTEEIPKSDPNLNDGSDNQDGNNNQINAAIGSTNDWQTWYLDRRNEEWAREDQIRKEQQQRDDTAYTRMIKDMRNAGINPNVTGGTPNYGTSSDNTSISDTGASNSVQMSAQDQEAILTYAQLKMQLKKAEMEQASEEKKMELQKQLKEAELTLSQTSLGLNGSMALINMIVNLAQLFA